MWCSFMMFQRFTGLLWASLWSLRGRGRLLESPCGSLGDRAMVAQADELYDRILERLGEEEVVERT